MTEFTCCRVGFRVFSRLPVGALHHRQEVSFIRPRRLRGLRIEELEARRLLSGDVHLSYGIEAKARISQFRDYQTETFTGTDPVVFALPVVTATDSFEDKFAHAEASPFLLTSAFSTTNTGINVFDADAVSSGTVLQIESGPELLALIPTGETYIDIMLTGTVSADVNIALGSVFADQGTTGISVGVNTTSGSLSIIPDFASSGSFNRLETQSTSNLTTGGILSDFAANGGVVEFSIPARVKPFVDGGLAVRLAHTSDIGGLAVSEGFVDSTVTLDISQFPSSASLMDGTLLSDLGIEVTLLPTTDASAPDTTIDRATEGDGTPVANGGVTPSESISFDFSSTEPGSSFECSLDSSGFVACLSPQGYSGLADGSHSFDVRAIDLAGNIDATPATFSWIVDAFPIKSEITVDPGTVGTAPANPIPITSTDLVGQPLDGQEFVVDIVFSDDKYVEFAPLSFAGGLAVAMFEIEYSSVLAPTGASQGQHGFLDDNGDFETFGPNGSGSGTLFFRMTPTFPEIVKPETYDFFGLRYTFTLPVVPGQTVAAARLKMAATVTSTLTVRESVSPDTTPPELLLPADIVTEAASSAGAVVAYDASANDNVDGPVSVICSPVSGSTFPLGTTSVSCSATDTAGNIAEGSFNVTVQDTTAPELSLPADIVVEATSPDGAVVEYTASATDLVDAVVSVICSPVSGSTFPLGTTSVSCSATDTAGNIAEGSFNVTVQDTTVPELSLPADIVVEATSPDGAVVEYTASRARTWLMPWCRSSAVRSPALPSRWVPRASAARPRIRLATLLRGASMSRSRHMMMPSSPCRQTSWWKRQALTEPWLSTLLPRRTWLMPWCRSSAVRSPARTFPLGTTSVSCSATDTAGNIAEGELQCHGPGHDGA